MIRSPSLVIGSSFEQSRGTYMSKLFTSEDITHEISLESLNADILKIDNYILSIESNLSLEDDVPKSDAASDAKSDAPKSDGTKEGSDKEVDPNRKEYKDNKISKFFESIWAKIKAVIMDIFNKVERFVNKFIASSKALRTKVTTVYNHIKKTDAIPRKKMNAGIARGFASTSKVKGDDVETMIKRHLDTYGEIQELFNITKSISENIISMTDQLKNESILQKLMFWNDKEDRVKDSVNQEVTSNVALKTGAIGGADKYLFNGEYYEYSVKKAGDGILGILAKSKDTPVGIKIETKKMELPKPEELEDASKDQLSKICDLLIDYLNVYDKFTKQLNDEVKTYKNNITKLDYSVKRTTETVKNKEVKETNKASSVLKEVINDLSGTYTGIMRLNSMHGKLSIQMGYMAVKYVEEHF